MIDETKYPQKVEHLPIFFLYFIFFKQLFFCHFFGQNTHPNLHQTPSSQPIFNNEKRKRNKNTLLQKIFHTSPAHSFFSLYHTHIFVFSVNFTVDSSALFRKIETLFLKKEPQQHKDVSIITDFVQMGCT